MRWELTYTMRDILGAMSKTSVGLVASLFLNTVASKIMAVILGPAGIGLYSMLAQLNQTSGLLATLAGGPALVQGIASKEKTAREKYIRAVFWVFLIGGLVVAVALIMMAPVIASSVLGSSDSATVWLVRCLSLPVALNAFSTYFGGVLNGYRAIGQIAAIQVAVASVFAVVAYPLALAAHSGYLLALVWLLAITSSFSLALNIFVAARNGWTEPITLSFRKSMNGESIRHFVLLAGATLVTALLSSFTLLTIRMFIIQNGGLDEAGLFNAAWSLSLAYVGVILVSCSTYYLPTLSRILDQREKLALIRDFFRISIIVIVPIIVFMVTARQFVVSLLFSSEFLEATATTRWMVVGDYMRVTGWVLAMPIFAYRDVRTFLLLECSASVGFLAGSLVTMGILDSIEGVGICYVVMNSLYAAFAFVYLVRRHRLRLDSRSKFSWLGGLGIILVASAFAWNDVSVSWPKCLASVAASFIFMIAVLEPKEKSRLWSLARSISKRLFRQ